MTAWETRGGVVWERHPFRLYEATVGNDSPYRGVNESFLVREISSDVQDSGPFLESADLACRIDHPGVERVVAWDRERGQWLQERYEGWSMRRWMKARGKMHIALACLVVESVCSALETLHGITARGPVGVVLHRDLSPDGVVVTTQGAVKITQPVFVEIRKYVDVTGPALPTPIAIAHLAPEQASGERTDRTTDIYQATGLLYSLLTAAPPFEATSTLEMVHRIRDVPAPLPSDLNPDVPTSLDRLVTAGLHKDPQQRPASARQLRQMIAAIREDEGFDAHEDLAPMLLQEAKKLGEPTLLGLEIGP